MKQIIEKFKRIFAQDLFFYGFLTILLISIGQLPIILHFFHTPAGYYYPLLDKITADDYYYLALIRFGMGSSWVAKLPYVVADHQGSLIQIFFIWLGKLSFITGIGPAEIFAIFRVVGGLIFAVASILFLRTILNKSQARLAFIFFLFSQPLGFIKFGQYLGQDFDIWIWHFGEAARRVSAMPPHYTFGKGLTILALVFLITYFKKAVLKPQNEVQPRKTRKSVIGALIAGIIVFIAGIIYPPPVFIVLFSLGMAGIVYILVKASLANSFTVRGVLSGHLGGVSLARAFLPSRRGWFLGLVIFLLGALLPLLILKAELSKGYPWSQWNRIELGWNDPSMTFEWDYLRMLGILVLLVPFSLPKVVGRFLHLGRVHSATPEVVLRLFFLFWAISAFLLFPFANMLQIGKFRFIEGAQIVPLAILAVWGFNFIIKLIERYKNYAVAKIFQRAFLFLFVVNFCLFTFFQVMWSTKRLWGYWRNVYFPKDEQEALSFLENKVAPNSIVLAELSASNYIPSFARVKTIIGFPGVYEDLYEFNLEKSNIDNILTGTSSEAKAREYMLKRKADYIYYQIYAYGEKKLYPEILESVFKNNSIEIYKVKDDLSSARHQELR